MWDELLIFTIGAIVIYICCIAVTTIMLIIELIALLTKKFPHALVPRGVLLGQISKMVSALTFICFVIAGADVGRGLIIITGLVEGLCAINCLGSAVLTVREIVKAKDKGRKEKVMYPIFILCNLYVVGFIIWYEIDRFL